MAKTSKAARPDDKVEKEKPAKLRLPKAKAVKTPKPKTPKAKAPKPKLIKPKLAKPKAGKSKSGQSKSGQSKSGRAGHAAMQDTMLPHAPALRVMPPLAIGATAAVLDRLWGVVMARRDAD